MIQLTTAQKVGIGTFVVAAAFATGRYTVPVKIKTETKIVEVEKKDTTVATNTKKQQKKKVVIVEDDKPTGEKHKVTTITDDTDTNKQADTKTVEVAKSNSDTTKEIKKDSGHFNLSLLAGTSVISPSTTGVVYGGHITRDIIGPVNIGIWGLSNGTGGASVGITF